MSTALCYISSSWTIEPKTCEDDQRISPDYSLSKRNYPTANVIFPQHDSPYGGASMICDVDKYGKEIHNLI